MFELPCQANPQMWDAPEGAPDWAHLPETARAQRICLEQCPRWGFIACARRALTAGSGDRVDSICPATGVIMAGVACRGDKETTTALQAVIASALGGERLKAPHDWRIDGCADCKRPMVSPKSRQKGVPRHDSHGRCASCAPKYRAGNVRIVRVGAK